MDILSGISVRGDSTFNGFSTFDDGAEFNGCAMFNHDSKFYGVFAVDNPNDSVFNRSGGFSSAIQSSDRSTNISRILLVTNSDVSIPSGCSSFHVPGVKFSSITSFVDASATQICGSVLKSVEVDSKIVCGDESPIITVVPKDDNWSLTIHVLHY